MTIVKKPQADPTADAYIETQTVTLSGGADTSVTFDAGFSATPKVFVTPDAENTVSVINKDSDGCTVTTAATSDVVVDLLVIGG